MLFVKTHMLSLRIGDFNPIGFRCVDFYKAGIIPNPNANQCLKLMAINGNTIECCYNNIIPANDGSMCPTNTLGIDEHCYTLNKQNRDPANKTPSERQCQEVGGNLLQFSAYDEIDVMTDILMSHPKDSFSLIKYPFFTGLFSNPHFPFTSSSSGQIIRSLKVGPRFMNETANDLGACTVMKHVASFEEYSVMDSMINGDDAEPSNKTEPWYWIPKHKMTLRPMECTKPFYSICDHKAPLIAESYMISSSELLQPSKLQNAVGFFIHPMNSISACMAYCISRGNFKTILVLGKTCLCTKGGI